MKDIRNSVGVGDKLVIEEEDGVLDIYTVKRIVPDYDGDCGWIRIENEYGGFLNIVFDEIQSEVEEILPTSVLGKLTEI